ncbi:MAG: YceI family protein [Chloroflexi bacterium]|nr:YceI family protein [Chloroflexota bacterium]
MNWQIDYAHSEINFTVRHMMISKVRGSFDEWSGIINFDPENPTNTTVDVTVQLASVNTNEQQRDDHLRSPDFFDVATHPEMRFKSTKVEQNDVDEGLLYGELTIRGITKPVVLDVNYAGQAKSPWGTTSAGFSASATINRKDWDLTWNQALETGGVLVSDKISIGIELELIQQAEAVPA